MVNKNSNLPQWLDSFISNFEKTAEQTEVTVDSMPSFSWENEQYHVGFNEIGAVVYNRFGNVIREFPGVKTVEEAE